MRHVAEFLALAAVIVAIPGPAVTLVLRSALTGGARRALPISAGVFAGDLVWAAASVVGVTAILVASGAAFEALRLAGAAYLVFLGIRLLLRGVDVGDEGPGLVGRSTRRSFLEGIASELSNPKTAVVYTSVLPQFLDPGASALDAAVVGTIFAVLGLASLLAWTVVGAASRGAVARSRVRDVVVRASGGVLVAFGARLALDR